MKASRTSSCACCFLELRIAIEVAKGCLEGVSGSCSFLVDIKQSKRRSVKEDVAIGHLDGVIPEVVPVYTFVMHQPMVHVLCIYVTETI